MNNPNIEDCDTKHLTVIIISSIEDKEIAPVAAGAITSKKIRTLQSA